VSPDVSARQCKRLEDAGWSLVKFRSGKSLWRRPEGGRLYRLKSAHKHVNRQEWAELEAAGWEAVEGDGTTYWCRPDSGYLYAQEAAVEVVRRTDEGGAP
jgi:hypothetical protein